MEERMERAYRAAARMIDVEATDEERALLSELGDDGVLVVPGGYDRVEEVLRLLGIPHRMVSEEWICRHGLRPDQMLVVNCPGHISSGVVGKVRAFVAEGGTLFTTDWALLHVVEAAFPGYVAYNRRATADDVVRVEVAPEAGPPFSDLFSKDGAPLWWLESGSYPFSVLRPDAVQVLIRSEELAAKYGEPAVAVRFEVGKGEVFHMISHYYLQRTETRTARHQKSWRCYVAEEGVPQEALGDVREFADLNVAEVESARVSARSMRYVLLARARRNRGTRAGGNEGGSADV
ncbi:MAG TPA: hypothetical protein VLH79_08395 [Chthonomonadales bacterium]|nr:hypothetical protein [Chthonomonadales bacterium]